MPKKKVSEEMEPVVNEAIETTQPPGEKETQPANDTPKEAPEQGPEESSGLSQDDILMNTSRHSARVEKMSKQQRKDTYASEHVYTENGVTPIETESTQKKAEYIELVNSQKANKILKGKIVGLHHAIPDKPSSPILAEILFGKGYWDVVIPAYLLFDYDLDEKYTSAEQNAKIEEQVQKRINSNVDFVVHTFTKEGIVFADRLAALSMKGVNHYLPKANRPAYLRPGLLVEGNVTMVDRTYAIVEAMGADIRIPQTELSWFHVGDAREEFKVGQKVIVRILSVSPYKTKKYNNSYTLVSVEGSIRLAQKDRRKEYYDSFKIGGLYAATVTYVENDVFVNLAGKMDALVAFPKFGPAPVRGEERVVRITGKDDEKMFIYGVFQNN